MCIQLSSSSEEFPSSTPYSNIETQKTNIVNMKDRKSKAERERTKLVYQELINIRNPGGRIINTGTPWHKEDAFCLMPAAEKYDCYHTAVGATRKSTLCGHIQIST